MRHSDQAMMTMKMETFSMSINSSINRLHLPVRRLSPNAR